MKNRTLWIVLIVVILLTAATVVFNTVHFYTIEYDLDPTCTASGGHYQKCALCRRVRLVSAVPAVGHKQTWFTVKEATSATEGIEELRCSVCNLLLETKRIPMKESPIPALYLRGSGMGMSATHSILADFVYRGNDKNRGENPDIPSSENDTASDETLLSDEENMPLDEDNTQSSGTTRVRLMDESADYDKKLSYVLHDFQVGEGQPPLFGDFGQSDEIRIYANNDDRTGVRRIVSYGQWRDIVAANYPDYARCISASDDTQYAGYNFLLYIRNQKPTYTFMGIYTLSIPYTSLVRKSMPDVRYILYQYGNRIDYVYGAAEDEETARQSFSEFENAPTDSLSYHTDLSVLIDYYAFSLMTANSDAFSDLYWVSPDGVLWYPVPNNMEHTYGSRSGTVALAEADLSVEPSQGIFFEFATAYRAEISKRITELKRGRLSPERIKEEFTVAVSKLDAEVYREDCALNNVAYHDPIQEVEELVAWYTEHLLSLR